MDFPLYHLDLLGNRVLIGVIAVVHVLVNHPLAVGAMPLITLMAWWAYRRGDEALDRLAYRLLAVCFIVTTTLGALTGVGIWLSASLVNPAAIGSLIRIFFWAWFAEWIVFVAEVSLILVFFLTWKRSNRDPAAKRRHLIVGAVLSLTSWLTMAVITAILGFMMDTGVWTQRGSFFSAVLNPIYVPQLMFRTPLAMISAGLFALFLIYFFTRGDRDLRARAIRLVSVWTLAWTPWCLLAGLLYWNAVPAFMAGHLPVALATQAFQNWHEILLLLTLAAWVIVVATAIWGLARPRAMPRVALLVPFVLVIGLLGYFERVREFIRKPYVLAGYMYANGIRVADYPLLAEEGLLAHAGYVPSRVVTDDNHEQLGEAVFMIACTRCHTTTGVNGVVAKLRSRFDPVFPDGAWDVQAVDNYLQGLHKIQPYMPPIPGTDEERGLLTEYLIALCADPAPARGAQHGVRIPDSDQVSRRGMPTRMLCDSGLSHMAPEHRRARRPSHHRRDAGATKKNHRRDAGATKKNHRRDAGGTKKNHRRDAGATTDADLPAPSIGLLARHADASAPETGTIDPPSESLN